MSHHSSDSEDEETPDYPFDSWDTYKFALLESLQTEFYDETYPEYFKAINKGKTELSIIKRLLPTSSAQVILDDIIDMTVNEGQRYAEDIIVGIGDSSAIIDFLLGRGAEFPWGILFALPQNYDFKDQFQSLNHTVKLIDMYGPRFAPAIPREILRAKPCSDEDDNPTCAGYIRGQSTYIASLN